MKVRVKYYPSLRSLPQGERVYYVQIGLIQLQFLQTLHYLMQVCEGDAFQVERPAAFEKVPAE